MDSTSTIATNFERDGLTSARFFLALKSKYNILDTYLILLHRKIINFLFDFYIKIDILFYIYMKKKKLPVVTYETVITINGKEHVQSSTSYTESVGEAITEGWLENKASEIIEYINEND